jgi:hypothetical protein
MMAQCHPWSGVRLLAPRSREIRAKPVALNGSRSPQKQKLLDRKAQEFRRGQAVRASSESEPAVKKRSSRTGRSRSSVLHVVRLSSKEAQARRVLRTAHPDARGRRRQILHAQGAVDRVWGAAHQKDASGNRLELFDGKLAIRKVVVRRKCHPQVSLFDGADHPATVSRITPGPEGPGAALWIGSLQFCDLEIRSPA